MLRPASWIRKSLRLSLLVGATLLVVYAGSGKRLDKFQSPDGRLTAVVTPADKKRGFEKYESRISILRSGGGQLSMHDFSSDDGEHGYGADQARWTPDSQYFVCQMRNSGGHSPMYVPVVFWSRTANHFYQLNDYTAWRTFAIAAPDKVKVDSWPGLDPATVSLSGVKEGQVTELR
jgi:hypothetical protein